MGSVTYNFLADSLFFHKGSLAENFRNETDERIERELQAYREHCSQNFSELINEIQNNNSMLNVFSSSEETSIDLLKQTALYIDQFIVHDPLFKFTDKQSEMSNITAKHLGYLNDENIDKQGLANACNFLKKITPMVAANYVKVFPLSYYFEAPKQIPITLPKDYYNDILPLKILDFFKANANIFPMQKLENGGWMIAKNRELQPCRSIAINFKDTNLNQGKIYHLLEQEILHFDESTRKVQFRMTLPDTVPDTNLFNAWVVQSVNSAARAFFDKVFIENVIASNLSSTYLCNNEFSSNLIRQNFDIQDNIQTFTASQIINFDLPFLDKVDIEKLMNIRENDADVFTNFRIELERNFRELRSINDSQFIQQKMENIFHELNDVQVQRIKQKMNHINRQIAIDSLLAIGGLAGSFMTNGFSLVATAVAIGKGYKDYSEYKEKIKENPSYLLWKIRK